MATTSRTKSRTSSRARSTSRATSRAAGSATRRTAKKSSRRSASARERISPNGDTRFVRRSTRGRFTESDDAGRSMSADRRKKAKRRVGSGQGDRGDRRRTPGR